MTNILKNMENVCRINFQTILMDLHLWITSQLTRDTNISHFSFGCSNSHWLAPIAMHYAVNKCMTLNTDSLFHFSLMVGNSHLATVKRLASELLKYLNHMALHPYFNKKQSKNLDMIETSDIKLWFFHYYLLLLSFNINPMCC